MCEMALPPTAWLRGDTEMVSWKTWEEAASEVVSRPGTVA